MSGKFGYRLALPVLFAVHIGASIARSQEPDTLYTLTFYAGGGYSRNFSSSPEPIPGLGLRHERNGMGGLIRVMWKPEHLLRVGLETGFTQVYSVHTGNRETEFGRTSYSSYLNVIPVSLTFSMPLMERLEGCIGSTSFILMSSTRAFGSSVSGVMISTGFSAGLSYLWPLTGDWNLGCELRWHHIDKSRDDNVMIHAVVAYRFLEW